MSEDSDITQGKKDSLLNNQEDIRRILTDHENLQKEEVIQKIYAVFERPYHQKIADIEELENVQKYLNQTALSFFKQIHESSAEKSEKEKSAREKMKATIFKQIKAIKAFCGTIQKIIGMQKLNPKTDPLYYILAQTNDIFELRNLYASHIQETPRTDITSYLPAPDTYRQNPLKVNVVLQMDDMNIQHRLTTMLGKQDFLYSQSIEGLDPTYYTVLVMNAASRIFDDSLFLKIRNKSIPLQQISILQIVPNHVKNLYEHIRFVQFGGFKIPSQTILYNPNDLNDPYGYLTKLRDALNNIKYKSQKSNNF